MSSSKTTKTTQSTANSLPDWLTSPYSAAVSKAGTLAAQPAISAGTQQALNGLTTSGTNIANTGTQALGTLTGLASGNVGANGQALVSAANGSALAANPWAANGQPTAVSGALSGMAANGGLDTNYIDRSGLNDTASGKYLTADSNPYIQGVAQQGADAAQARVNAQFGAAGRSNGSGLYAQLFGKGISDATNSVYAANYANERQLQQGAQNTLLGADQTAHESALSRQYGADTSIFGAQNASAENAATRASSAYANERALQQSASSGLLANQQQSISQLPSIMSAILGGNTAALSAGEYQDKAGLNQLQQYAGILSGLAAPYGQSSMNGTTTQTTSGLGSIVGQIAQLGGAASSLLGTGGLSSLSSFFKPTGAMNTSGPPAP